MVTTKGQTKCKGHSQKKKHKLQDNKYNCVLCLGNCEESTSICYSPTNSVRDAGLI
jgi:hypothetical protein